MRLYEFEGKRLLKSYGIDSPEGLVVKSAEEIHNPEDINKKAVKAQLLTVGSRSRFGAVKICDSFDEAKNNVKLLLHSRVCGEEVRSVLLEEKMEIISEYYLGVTYDTEARLPVVVFGRGGVDVETEKGVVKRHIEPRTGMQDFIARGIAKEAGFSGAGILKIAEIIKKTYNCFAREDAKLVEINPLADTGTGFMAVDVLVELDDDANFRHKERNLQPRTLANREPTERETAVKKINEGDYRGTVKYMELDGDIAFLAAGGGGSITCMDALINAGGSASNYTEYSGNPPKEKVYELTKAIVSKPGLNGLWIVGAIANFTRVDETMQGIVDALIEVKPAYPIVVRRSGPYEKEGLEILKDAAKEHGLDMVVYGKEMPMTKTAKLLLDKISTYKKKAIK